MAKSGLCKGRWKYLDFIEFYTLLLLVKFYHVSVSYSFNFFGQLAELEKPEALKYLYGWLKNHPKYKTLVSPQLSESLYFADVSDFIDDLYSLSKVSCIF